MGRGKRWLRAALFFAGGALAGLAWYQFFGCNGSCVISSSPLRSMLCLGVVGWLLGVAVGMSIDLVLRGAVFLWRQRSRKWTQFKVI